jgi:hypothetical protein
MTRASCEDCYFHRAALCALRLEEACPTFRHHARTTLVRPEPVRVTPPTLAGTTRERELARFAAA